MLKEYLVEVDMANSLTTNGKSLLRYWNKGGFILCVGGYADVQINEQCLRLSYGSILVVTPLVQIVDFRPAEDYREISFVSELKESYNIFRLISDTSIPLLISKSPCWSLSGKEIEYVLHQREQIKSKMEYMSAAESADERRLIEYHIRLIKHETMLEVVGNRIRQVPSISERISHQTIVTYRFILSLHENYTSKRTVAWYASEANLSPGHFTALVKQTTGNTPSQWIATVTTTYAKMMLEQGGRSIKEIAFELNFPEQFTFRKYFKRHAGLSPKEYRERYAHG